MFLIKTYTERVYELCSTPSDMSFNGYQNKMIESYKNKIANIKNALKGRKKKKRSKIK